MPIYSQGKLMPLMSFWRGNCIRLLAAEGRLLRFQGWLWYFC